MILLTDDDLWRFPPQRRFLQELLQLTGYAGRWGVVGVIWDPVSILCVCVYTGLLGRQVYVRGFPGDSDGKESACNTGDLV